MHGVPNPIARGGVARAELRPANFRPYRIVKRLREQKGKDLYQKLKVVTQEAVATGKRAPRDGNRPDPQAHRVRVHLLLRALLHVPTRG